MSTQKKNRPARTARATPVRSAPKWAAGPAVRRGRGRPARLSREAIIEQALALLADRSPEDLTLTAVAARLGTATMSLYNYFPNHNALLNAVADHAFSLFVPPRLRTGQRWQDALLAWLWALQEHFTRYPVVLKVISLEGQLTAGWMKVAGPLIQVLRGAGFEGPRLAFASVWFVNEAVGVIMMELFSASFRQPLALSHVAELDSDEQAVFLELRSHLSDIDSRRVLDFSFSQLIRGLERLLADPDAFARRRRRRAAKAGE